MSHKTSRNLMIVLGLALALAALFATLQVVRAQSPTPAGVVAAPTFPEPPDHLQGVRFVHQATAANTSGHITTIDHYLTNGNPDAVVFVTQNWNPGGVGGTYNDHAIGVYYDSVQGKWAIFNQDIAAMPVGAAFNVLIPDSGSNVFTHQATAGNTYANSTDITHPLTDLDPDALVFVTQNWNGSGSGIYNNHETGVWYNDGTDKWAIFNQDYAAMPVGAFFNGLVLDADANTFVHQATVENSVSNRTFIDHPLANNNPHALLFVTQNWNPGGVGSTYNDHAIGVYYSQGIGRWAIINQDIANMPVGAAFSVVIPTNDTAFFVHEATPGNSADNYTLIDHPLNDNPNAIAFVTQNWNPGGVGGTYNDQETGLWYYNALNSWSIFNQSYTSTMPTAAAFNVLVPNVDAGVFIHKTTNANRSGSLTYIDHPLTNSDPDAIMFITPNWNPGGVGGVYSDHTIAVYYNYAQGKWAIFNQDSAIMPISATFNVMVPLSDTTVFVHRATAGNTFGNYTYIDHPLANDNPAALVFVTQNWNPGGVGGTYNDHAIGVWYDNDAVGGGGKWAIFNQDGVDMPEGVAFNVMIKVHRVYLPLVMR